MLRTLLDARTLLAMAVALAVGVWGLRTYPLPSDNVFLALIALRRPDLHQGLQYGYATLWFTTPFFGASLLGSLFAIAMYRHAPRLTFRSLPPYIPPEDRPAPSLVLGEAHHETRPGRAPDPQWLTIPQRGLYTGVMVLGSVGTGKTSACMYPYVDQLVRWRSHDADHKLGGLVMEVKGDFCRQVQAMLRACGREADYVEVGLDSGVCYNPLHNDLDPYAVAYAIATLLNNLFGKSKEPFWQQAYTDLLKFVILLRRLTDGYTTFAEVYRYILDDKLIDRDIRKLKAALASPPDVIRLSKADHHLYDPGRAWSHWYPEDADHMAHPFDAELEGHLASLNVQYEVRPAQGDGWRARCHQMEALDRWYIHSWSRLDTRLRSSITEGIVVFLSLFDDNPAVHRAFCPPRSAYLGTRAPGDPGHRTQEPRGCHTSADLFVGDPGRGRRDRLPVRREGEGRSRPPEEGISRQRPKSPGGKTLPTRADGVSRRA